MPEGRFVIEQAPAGSKMLDLVPDVPTAVWGRDQLPAGEMWNSNSVISWLVLRSGLPADAITPPRGGRAPGWHAGIVIARRHETGAPLVGAMVEAEV